MLSISREKKKSVNSKVSTVETSISIDKTPISLENDVSTYCNPEIQHLSLDEVNFIGSDVWRDYGIVKGLTRCFQYIMSDLE